MWIGYYSWANLHDSKTISLSKYAQNQDMFICDFVTHDVKLCQINLHNMYCDEEKKYSRNDFSQLKNFVEQSSNVLHIAWWKNLAISTPSVFFFNGIMYNIHKTYKLISIHTMVIHEDWAKLMCDVKM